MKICLLEDNQEIREVLELILQGEAYRVESYQTIAGFTGADMSEVDLFLLDVMLPDGDGMDVCRRLKNDAATKAIPVMMMSAHADIGTMKSGCKAEDYIDKPFDINVLLDKIQRLIEVVKLT